MLYSLRDFSARSQDGTIEVEMLVLAGFREVTVAQRREVDAIFRVNKLGSLSRLTKSLLELLRRANSVGAAEVAISGCSAHGV